MDPRLSDDERLGQALIARGLLTREEFDLVRAGESSENPEIILSRLISAGYLTASQGARLQQELPTLLQQQIPGYQILEKIGRGAMGTVYRALQMSMNREVAIKILHPRLVGNGEYLARFHREAHVAARFSSPHIVQAIDVGSAGELHYFVMEYVEGVTIKEALDRGERFSPRESLAILMQITQALDQAHRRRLVHRDIKPANIIIALDGTPKLADLGMAREMANFEQIQAEKGKTLGTPYYMAPEQIRAADDLDIRADIYSLGATWFHMLTGRVPFAYPRISQALRAHLDEPVALPHTLNPSVPESFSQVLGVMMAKKPDERYSSPADLLVDLEALEKSHAPTLVTGAGTSALAKDSEHSSGPFTNFLHKSIPMAWAAGLLLLLVVSVLVNLLLGLRRP